MNRKKLVFLLSGSVAAACAAGVFLYDQNNTLEITPYHIEAAVSSPLRLTQLSDLHEKEFGKDNHRLYDAVKSTRPDLILYTGDLVSNARASLKEPIDFLDRLQQLAPVVYITGNHEHNSGVSDLIIPELEGRGVFTPQNEIITLYIKQETVSILGLNEKLPVPNGSTRKGLFQELEKTPGLRLVLSHYPENFALKEEKSYQQYDFDLMLSGHAHGGQFRLPLIGPVFSPSEGLFPKYSEGIHGDDSKMIVSRGLGPSAFPFRLFNHPELVTVTVTPKQDKSNQTE